MRMADACSRKHKTPPANGKETDILVVDGGRTSFERRSREIVALVHQLLHLLQETLLFGQKAGSKQGHQLADQKI